jgi:phosphoglycerol transferase MdoB-like AlkP superfamily enzyme
MRSNTVASQIDLAPTLLSLIGVACEQPMIGRDLMRPEMRVATGRAINQFNGRLAYMEGNRVAVLRKDAPVGQFTLEDGHLLAANAVDDPLSKRALAHSAWSSMAYENSLYRLPSSDSRPLRLATTLPRLDRRAFNGPVRAEHAAITR